MDFAKRGAARRDNVECDPRAQHRFMLDAQLRLQVPQELENEILWDSLFFYSHFIYSCRVNWILKRHLNLGCFFPSNHQTSQNQRA